MIFTCTFNEIALINKDFLKDSVISKVRIQYSESSEDEPEISETRGPVRMKLRDESESKLAPMTDMKITGYMTSFTEGESTHDELDEEILETPIYIYKVKLNISDTIL